jgi:formamidopyrimidine-DNA glycosylase
MPELPEVETTRLGIAPLVENQVISHVIVREPRLRWQIPENFATILSQQAILHLHRRGKYLLFQCTTGHLLIHLGMSGSLRLLPATTPWRKHDHVDLVFTNHQCLRYHDPRRFGAILWSAEPINSHPLLCHLGPEPLEKDFTGNYLHHLAQGKRRSLKNFIMDSHIVVGVGNIYANESLFLAKIHPARLIGEISLKQYQILVKIIKQVLQNAIAHGGTTLRDFTDSMGHSGHFQQQLHVYGRAGLPCTRCGNPIQQVKINQRASYYCSICQN